MKTGDMHTKQEDQDEITFTVAECGEYHGMGEYHEGIRTLDAAIALYRKINPDRMNGIPSVGIKIHMGGTEACDDMQFDILSGSEINSGILQFLPEHPVREKARQIIEKTAAMFPEKEIAYI